MFIEKKVTFFKDRMKIFEVPKATYGLEFSGPLCELNYMLDNIDEWAAPQKVIQEFLNICSVKYLPPSRLPLLTCLPHPLPPPPCSWLRLPASTKNIQNCKRMMNFE